MCVHSFFVHRSCNIIGCYDFNYIPVFESKFAIYRPDGAADIRYAESCMKNGFGLRYLHKFLSIPFLQLQVITET